MAPLDRGLRRPDSRAEDLIPVHRRARHLAPDPIEEVEWVIRLGEGLIDAQVMERGDVAVEDGRATDEDRLLRPQGLDPPADVYPRKTGQIKVEQHKIEGEMARIELRAF